MNKLDKIQWQLSVNKINRKNKLILLGWIYMFKKKIMKD